MRRGLKSVDFWEPASTNPCILSTAGEKEERKLTVYWLFNIYWIVTIIGDLGYFWTTTVFDEKILKSYTKLCLPCKFPQAWKTNRSTQLFISVVSAIPEDGNLGLESKQQRSFSFFCRLISIFKIIRLSKISIAILANIYWVAIMY